MALSKSALKRAIDSVPEGHDVGVWVVRVCRAVEAEVHKQDEALIRQLVEALAVATTPLAKDRQEVLAAITAARARLEWLGKLDQHLEGLAGSHTQ